MSWTNSRVVKPHVEDLSPSDVADIAYQNRHRSGYSSDTLQVVLQKPSHHDAPRVVSLQLDVAPDQMDNDRVWLSQRGADAPYVRAALLALLVEDRADLSLFDE